MKRALMLIALIGGIIATGWARFTEPAVVQEDTYNSYEAGDGLPPKP